MTLLDLKMDYHKGFKRPSLWLLDTTRKHYATDPRDKIYGLLGMSSDYSSEELIPNYHRTVNEVYVDLVEAHLTRYSSLHILNICEPQRAREAGLPSWAPDWARDEGRKGREPAESPLAYAYIPDAESGEAHQTFISNSTPGTNVYHASSDASFQSYPFAIEKDTRILSLWGWHLGRVEAVSPVILPAGEVDVNPADVIDTARHLITWLRSFGMPDEYAPTGEP